MAANGGVCKASIPLLTTPPSPPRSEAKWPSVYGVATRGAPLLLLLLLLAPSTATAVVEDERRPPPPPSVSSPPSVEGPPWRRPSKERASASTMLVRARAARCSAAESVCFFEELIDDDIF